MTMAYLMLLRQEFLENDLFTDFVLYLYFISLLSQKAKVFITRAEIIFF